MIDTDLDHFSASWSDGLNKPLSGWDASYYLHDIRSVCNGADVQDKPMYRAIRTELTGPRKLKYPEHDSGSRFPQAYRSSHAALGRYIIQAARFDPFKGTPDVINAYITFDRRREGVIAVSKTQQL